MSEETTKIDPSLGHVKVRISVAGDWHNFESEGLWCEPADDGLFRVRNIPFYAYGLSLDDLIEAEPDKDSLLSFKAVKRPSGHHVYRCIVKRESPGNAADHLKTLNEMDCWYETAMLGELELFAIDVPRGVDVERVYQILEKGLEDDSWDFEEANYVAAAS